MHSKPKAKHHPHKSAGARRRGIAIVFDQLVAQLAEDREEAQLLVARESMLVQRRIESSKVRLLRLREDYERDYARANEIGKMRRKHGNAAGAAG